MAQDDLNRLTIDKQRHTPAGGAGKKRRTQVVTVLVLLALVLAIWTVAARRSVEVEVATVSLIYPSQTISLLNASGYVVAQRKAAVASKATGRLEWLGVEEGSVVRAGQLLARLENRDVAAEKGQASATLSAARDNLDQARVEQKDAARALSRAKELIGQGIIAQADYDTAEARYQRAVAAVAAAQANISGAQSALRGAEASLDYTLIRAPFDGVVLTKNADVGDIVSPLAASANAKAAVVTMADMGSLQVEADVSEANLAKVKVGQPCEILLDALPDVRFRGALYTIVPTADRSKGSVMVKVRFLDKDTRILPEMSAKVAFLEREMKQGEGTPRVAVSPTAVVRRDGRDYVFKVVQGRVQLTPVVLGGKMGDLVQVASGVKAGERIATKPLDKLRDGSRVKTAEK
ncbi:efflux RND transporter periplasmic adaptor subunit [Geomonas nitrogeniifigens]|uniref:Efflux RND transporter periplasmic adaptor subunit n=1 Tax=Geomonas diazotrophica TaxID=2843197 RepID=A0ABX8JK80_9BACT|nr:efflux RND transporter periplasmic adaptor subunit [Geomonas nitrogeniifigens]QWV98391.1 efflux RND transporter periplasmic adaptor subunit [Geomonas nitrogeniifigens]QXE87573.1 efflux RND transporter periplasmic adaptor subunit [Geomonas nitrogeniifigens]